MRKNAFLTTPRRLNPQISHFPLIIPWINKRRKATDSEVLDGDKPPVSVNKLVGNKGRLAGWLAAPHGPASVPHGTTAFPSQLSLDACVDTAGPILRCFYTSRSKLGSESSKTLPSLFSFAFTGIQQSAPNKRNIFGLFFFLFFLNSISSARLGWVSIFTVRPTSVC